MISFIFSGVMASINPSDRTLIFIDKVIGTGAGQLLLEAGWVILANIVAALMFAFSTYILEQQIEV